MQPKPAASDAEVAGTADTLDPADPFIAREISGKYRVLRRIGAGGMGAVYKAQHLTTGGDVAIKFLHGTALGDKDAIHRFQLEAQNVAALRHANTVRVIDFGLDQGTLFLVMEYLDGQPLSDVLMREGPMSWARAVHVVRQVLKSLWEAHEHPKRIIHRDIKPANILLVDLPGDPDHVRVVDFGIARALDGSGVGTQGLLGTPFYMAPELWRGETVDARTDLYALGCVAYQCLAGTPPFVPPPSATDSLYPLLEMHLNAAPPSLRAAQPNVPTPIVAWVDHMLAKEPARRPASARLALEALDRAARAAAEQKSAGPPEAARPAAHPLAAAQPVPAGPSSTAAHERRRSPGLFIALGSAALLAVILTVVLLTSRSSDDVPGRAASPLATAPSGASPLAAPHPTLGAFVVSYRARLSAADHLDENGDALDDAAAIVTLDRIRMHAGVGDPEDGAEGAFAQELAQGQLYQLVDRFIDAPTRRAIIEGRPLVEVTLYERGLTLRVVSP